MGKIIRPRYSVEFSIGILLLVFALSLFLSLQIFPMSKSALHEGKNVYFGAALISSAVIIMVLVLWEELLFPVRLKVEEGSTVFRNHRNKLKTQILIYCAIPFIFILVYAEYDVNLVRFLAWAVICIAAPVAGKLISGIRNYNDFLKLSHDTIAYQNNEKKGVFPLKDVKHITLIKDERNILHKVELFLFNNNRVTIDLDEMELEAFIGSIENFMTAHYSTLLKTQAK
jgi:hypothetical protein